MKIRSHLTLNLGIFILFSVVALFVLNYFLVRNTLVEKANEDLVEMEKAVYRSAQAILDTAIANYLRGITKANLEQIEKLYARSIKGELTEAQAKHQVQELFAQQQVGQSGYLVAVEEKNDKLYLDMHPFLSKVDCTDTEGCQEWAKTRNGYTEYDWKNPLDNSFKKKAAYVMEFSPWNWVIGASSYRNEFVSLVRVEELKALLEPIRINKSGYFFIFDKDYNWVVHPLLDSAGFDPVKYQREEAVEIMKKLLEDEDGYMTYSWKNPSDPAPRQKYAFIEHLEGYDWYLAASGYYSEVLEPITYFKRITIGMVILASIVLVLLIYRLSRSITEPLVVLEHAVTSFYQTKKTLQWSPQTIHEINVLGRAFSRMTNELTKSMHALRSKVDELATSEKEKDAGRQLLDSMINSIPSAIIGVDAELKITQCNTRAGLHVGKDPSTVLGKDLFTIFPEISEYAQIITGSIKSNSIHSLDSMTMLPGENNRIFEITISPISSLEEQGAVIRIDEMTEKVEMEQRLRQSQKMDAVGQLAGGVAHDFNNMLSGIMGAAELLRLKVDQNEQPLVNIISSAAGRANELILKLLAFSRKDKIAFSPVNIHTVILDTVEILKRTVDKKITITRNLEAGLHTVMGDWSQLQNGLLNIGINAGHAMPDGGTLRFSTSLQNLDNLFCEHSPFDLSPGWFIRISIKDTGCGIGTDHQKKIFEPFYTTKEQGKGTGLGLAAVYGTITQHCGSISVYSEEGKGAEFLILLPVCTNENNQEPTLDGVTIRGEGCILIVDDEPIVRTTAKLMLEKLGYTTLEAEDGQAGVEIYRQNRNTIDLVILDMIMPVMDGTNCFYQLKKINPEIRVIISSGFSRDADLQSLKQAGLMDFIRKPYNLIELSEKVARVLSE